MKDAKVLSTLIYCTKCYTNYTTKDRYYIGECMHIICQSCFTSKCHICASSNFVILTDTFMNKLLKNPSETHIEPIDTAMFQISAALTLLNKQRSEIHKLKGYVRRCKEEVNRVKNVKQEKKGMFCFDNKQNAAAKKTIDQIYAKKRSIETNNQKISDSRTEHLIIDKYHEPNVKSHKSRYLNSITNRVGRKKLFTDYNRQNVSMSSSKSMRLTVPKNDNEFKYVYRKQHDF